MSLPLKRRQYRETPDVADAACRLIRSIGKRIATEDPEALVLLRALDRELGQAWGVAIDGQRRSGFLDRQIGEVLGCSRQAVEQRWPRNVSDLPALPGAEAVGLSERDGADSWPDEPEDEGRSDDWFDDPSWFPSWSDDWSNFLRSSFDWGWMSCWWSEHDERDNKPVPYDPPNPPYPFHELPWLGHHAVWQVLVALGLADTPKEFFRLLDGDRVPDSYDAEEWWGWFRRMGLS